MKYTALIVCGTALLGVTACSSSPRTLPAGEYNKTEKATNSEGTNIEKNTKTHVYYDENGNKRAVQETETTTDPEGLFNKSTSKSTKTY